MIKLLSLHRKLGEIIAIELQKMQVLSATCQEYSGSLHTYNNCSKYSESTVRIGTHVKPVIFALNIFAVYSKVL